MGGGSRKKSTSNWVLDIWNLSKMSKDDKTTAKNQEETGRKTARRQKRKD